MKAAPAISACTTMVKLPEIMYISSPLFISDRKGNESFFIPLSFPQFESI
jgi:hypothetical protein